MIRGSCKINLTLHDKRDISELVKILYLTLVNRSFNKLISHYRMYLLVIQMLSMISPLLRPMVSL